MSETGAGSGAGSGADGDAGDERGPAHCETVQAEWVDYNGHMNVAYYVLAFDHATDAVLDRLGLGEDYRRRSGCSVFVAELHVTYRDEALEGDALRVTTQLLGSDDKRLVLFHEMTCQRSARPIAGNEVLCIHVDLATRRAAPWPAEAAALLEREVARHRRWPRPEGAGRSIALAPRR
jgi:acyl-CoA thioester hydrolase